MSYTFNSRPHTEVDGDVSCTPLNRSLSTHDLTRRSTSWKQSNNPMLCLSTHDLTRRSTVIAETEKPGFLSFNSRPHTEVDASRDFVRSFSVVFQLTTSHGGRRLFRLLSILRYHLSTHDLTRRSTVRLPQETHPEVLSTHDLTRRSTPR